VFGVGSFEVLGAENPSVFGFVREWDDPSTPGRDIVLCVYNLSRFAQPCELHLAQYEGFTPHELLGRVPFPRIGELPYFVTLAPYGYFWFRLVEATS
jgi:maltose alpha-D-glucosyltransferase/alpha-amylase